MISNNELKQIMKENQYMQALDMELIELEPGYAKGRMKVSPKLHNPYGSVHGGALYSLADVISGFAACSYGTFASTISGNMNFIKPAIKTQYVTCEASEVRQGHQVSVYEVTLTNDNQEVLETGTFTFYMMKDK